MSVLKAKKEGVQQPVQQQPVQQTLQQNVQQQAVAVSPSAVVDLNVGVLDGMEGMGDSNRVGIDGTEFEYKATGERKNSIQMIVSYGRRIYQYWSEDKQLCESYDGKVSTDNYVCATCDQKRNKNCKFKFEIRWLENNPETGEPQELIMTLPTTSAIAFVNYVKELAKENLGVGQVLTEMTLKRVENEAKQKYSIIEFSALSEVE